MGAQQQKDQPEDHHQGRSCTVQTAFIYKCPTDDTTDGVERRSMMYVPSIANSGNSYDKNILLNKSSVDEYIARDSHRNGIGETYVLHVCNVIMLFII